MTWNGQMTLTDLTPTGIRYLYLNGARWIHWPDCSKPFAAQGFRVPFNQTQGGWFIA